VLHLYESRLKQGFNICPLCSSPPAAHSQTGSSRAVHYQQVASGGDKAPIKGRKASQTAWTQLQKSTGYFSIDTTSQLPTLKLNQIKLFTILS